MQYTILGLIMKSSPRGLERVHRRIDMDIQYSKTVEELKNSNELYQKVKNSGWVIDGFKQHNLKLQRISYKLNSFGFRCDYEFNKDSKGIAFLGCSDTFGSSQHNHKIWPTLVSKHFDKVCWNLGVGGGSVSTSYRVLKSHIDSIDVDYVCMLSPSSFRSESYFLNDDGEIQKIFIFPNTDLEKYPPFVKETFKRIWTLEENYELEYLKSLDAIEGICTKRGIQFIHIENPNFLDYKNPISQSMEEEIMINPRLRENCARDGHHAGEFFQKKTAEYFINEIINRT